MLAALIGALGAGRLHGAAHAGCDALDRREGALDEVRLVRADVPGQGLAEAVALALGLGGRLPGPREADALGHHLASAGQGGGGLG